MKQLPKIGEELRPNVSKPIREEEEEIYRIKKTLCDEIWFKQKERIKSYITDILERVELEKKDDKQAIKEMPSEVEFINLCRGYNSAVDKLEEIKHQIKSEIGIG